MQGHRAICTGHQWVWNSYKLVGGGDLKQSTGMTYIGRYEHIPVNTLHRHDLIGLPNNIPTRKRG